MLDIYVCACIPGETEMWISVQHTSMWRPFPSGVEPATLTLHGLKTFYVDVIKNICFINKFQIENNKMI